VLAAFICPLLRGQTLASPQEGAVLAAYKSLEQAIRNGDAEMWLSLQDGETLAKMTAEMKDAIRRRRFSRPTYRAEALAVRVKENQAVVIGKLAPDNDTREFQYEYMTFVLENGQWKIALESFSDKPIEPGMVYARLPPSDGAFRRAGFPWQSIGLAGINTKFYKPEELPWKMQATEDNVSLYVRFTSAAPLPAPGLEVKAKAGERFPDTRALSSPPTFRIKMIMREQNRKEVAREIEVQAGAVFKSWSTFDSTGKANSTRYFVQYSLLLTTPTQGVQVGDRLFDTDTGDPFNHLITAHDGFLDFQIPFKALGVAGTHPPIVEIEECNSPGEFLPYHVVPFQQ